MQMHSLLVWAVLDELALLLSWEGTRMMKTVGGKLPASGFTLHKSSGDVFSAAGLPIF